MSKTKKVTAERKAALTQICDADSYVAIIRESLSDEQEKAHAPIHLANVLALTAEMYLLYYDSIGSAFATANDLAVTFNCKLSRDKDTVEISYMPVAKFKDSASATVEYDDNQPDLGDIKKEAKGRAPKTANPRLGNASPLSLPAPVTVDAEVIPDDAEEWEEWKNTPEGKLLLALHGMTSSLLGVNQKRQVERENTINEFIEFNGEAAMFEVWRIVREQGYPNPIREEIAARCQEIDPAGNYH